MKDIFTSVCDLCHTPLVQVIPLKPGMVRAASLVLGKGNYHESCAVTKGVSWEETLSIPGGTLSSEVARYSKLLREPQAKL